MVIIRLTQIYFYIIKHTHANRFYLGALNLHMELFTITVYSLLADTPHKRTPLLNGRFFCDRPFHMLLLIKNILFSGLF
jgi:hypothetical protein